MKLLIMLRFVEITIIAVLVFLTACAVTDARKESGFETELRRGDRFQHLVFKNGQPADDILHVYLEGDGRPWSTPNRISLDPTPKNPLMLKLMALDSSPAVYIGRPCHFVDRDDNCAPQWWTHKRYAAEVVTSINRVIQHYALRHKGIALFGHSGGGGLAMLIAARREDVVALVTLAGNLDIDRWSQYHGFSPLRGSLNPAHQPPLSASVLQLHYLGREDSNITESMIRDTVAKQPRHRFHLLDDFDHSCCWQTIWPQLLRELDNELSVSKLKPDS